MNQKNRRLLAIALSLFGEVAAAVAIYKTGNLLYLILLLLPPLQLYYVRKGSPGQKRAEADGKSMHLMLVPVAVYASTVIPLLVLVVVYAAVTGE